MGQCDIKFCGAHNKNYGSCCEIYTSEVSLSICKHRKDVGRLETIILNVYQNDIKLNSVLENDSLDKALKIIKGCDNNGENKKHEVH